MQSSTSTNTNRSNNYTGKSSLSEDQILAELLDRCDDWLWETVAAYRGRPQSPPVLNNEWQNCGYKQGYIGKFGFYPDGKAYVHCSYNNYKHGSTSFPYKETRNQIINDHRAGKIYAPRYKKSTQENEAPKPVKEELFRKALAEDKTLWDDGVENLPYLHNYWANKGFRENIIDPAIRYVAATTTVIAIMVKIIAIDGELAGFQKIYADGTKEFTKAMTTKGSFIVLGTNGVLPEKLKEIFTTEGLATGATVRQALDNQIPVICTLYSGNIEPVISALRTKYGTKSKCSITIVADDDKWKALNIDPVSKRAIGNAGLSKAHPVALRHRCKIVSPNFEGFGTSKLPTDFDDLRQLAGLDEVKRQLALARKPNLHLAITEQALIEERKRIWNNFLGHKVISINDKYIPDTVADEHDGNIRTLEELILAQKVSLLRCPIGSGKTTAISKLLKNTNGTILSITYLQSLAKEISYKFNIENYQDYQGYSSSDYAKITELQKLSICLNSLYKLLDKDGHLVRKFDMVVIDEIQQVIRRLPTKIKKKTKVLSALKQIVQQANHLVLMDAHIDSLTINLLKKWLPKEQFFVLLNEYQVGKDRNMLLYDHEGMILDKALEALNNDQKVFIVSNNKKAAWEAFCFLQSATSKKGLAITGDNSGDKPVEKFFSNVNREVLNYDFIVASPSITSGISIDEDVFGFVGGIFTHMVNTPMDCLQALGRVRKAKTFHVYVSDVKQILPTEQEHIAAKWTHTHKHDAQLLPFEDLTNEALIDVAQDYKEICIAATREANFSKQDFLTRFAKLCLLDGYNIQYFDTTDNDLEQAKFLQAEATDLEDLHFIKGQSTSKTINDEEKEALQEKPRKTLEETQQLGKKEILDFYCLPEDTPTEVIEQTIVEDKRGKTRQAITNLETALASDAQIQQMRKDETKADIELEPDKRAFATEREVYQQILTFAGINTELISDEIPYSADHLLETFVPWILANYMNVKGIFKRLATSEQIEKDPVRTFGTLLKRLGLSHHRPGRHGTEYVINITELENRRELIIKRGKVPIKTPKGAHDVYINIITTTAPTSKKSPTGGADDAK